MKSTLVAGWFSFQEGHATAGDLLARDVACKWLLAAGHHYDIALAPPFHGGVDWRQIDPDDYSHVLFVCGPFQRSNLELEFLDRFARCRLIGLNLSMQQPLSEWNPFDLLLERDSSHGGHPDMAFLSPPARVPIVGVCLVEPYPGSKDNVANEAINRLVNSRKMAVVEIDTRLDAHCTNHLRSAVEVESLIARVDVLLTTRLHGLVLALKNGLSPIAIDPEPGGGKIRRQADLLDWPATFVVDELDDQTLQEAFLYCLTDESRTKAKKCYEHAQKLVSEMGEMFVAELGDGGTMENRHQARIAAMPQGQHLTASAMNRKADSSRTPLISVIISCYNQAIYLGEAIESVLAQTYQNFEIIVIDDGSTDATPDVARKYVQVRYLSQRNQGLAAARNAGLQASQGRYLVFLDADDRLLPDALAAGLRCFEEYPDCAFVSGGHRRIDESGMIIEAPTPPRIKKDHYLAFLRGNYVGMHGAVLYQRKFLTASGGFCNSLPACEDYELYLRLARDHPVHCHGAVVAEYRIYGSSMSGDTMLMLPTVLKVLHLHRKHLKENPNSKQAFRAGVRYWTELYQEQFKKKLSQSWVKGEVGEVVSSVFAISRYAPKQFLIWAYLWVVRPALPTRLLRLWARLREYPYYPPVGRIRFGDLRRINPISELFGSDRGVPIDRYYIERFLADYSEDIQGRVLEVGDPNYTRQFGSNRVTKGDVLHVSEGNPLATFVGDLTSAGQIPSKAFDCVIVTQTLHLIYDLRAALGTLYRILKPSGVLLVTVPGVSQISHDQWGKSWYWSFTSLSIRQLHEEFFPADCVEVKSHGNVLAATAFLQGIATCELERTELDLRDPHYEVLITVRASRPPCGGKS